MTVDLHENENLFLLPLFRVNYLTNVVVLNGYNIFPKKDTFDIIFWNETMTTFLKCFSENLTLEKINMRLTSAQKYADFFGN